MTTQPDLLIIGGGVVGLTTALAMAKRNLSVTVLDAHSLEKVALTQPGRRVYAINHASKHLFQQLGVWELIPDTRCAPYRHMHIWDAASKACLDFDARDVADNHLGMIIDEAAIKHALLEALAEHRQVTCLSFNPVKGVSQEDEGLIVSTEHHTWQAKLTIIADGGESPSRQLLQVPITTWPYHQHALVATIKTEKSHQHTAWQVFNPDGPLAFLPLVDEHLCSIVWSTSPKRAQELQTMEEESFNQALGSAFSHKLGDVRLQNSRHQFPLIMRHASQYVGKNWVLMGDAAHTVHPLAGLGLNIGLADVATWLSFIDSMPGPAHSPSKKTLMTYQRQRKQSVWQNIALLGGLKTLFANPLPPLVSLRGLGLNLCNRLTPLKRMFIEHATGVGQF
jgi:2-octaprenylphenol hydroxylase